MHLKNIQTELWVFYYGENFLAKEKKKKKQTKKVRTQSKNLK
jgi:hypothetical protein